MLTHKEVFERVKGHLLEQGEKSTVDNLCKYRGEGGLQCAIGCLIEDDEYNPEMEGMSVDVLIDQYEFRNFGREHVELLTTLQSVHDLEPPEHWAFRLEVVQARM